MSKKILITCPPMLQTIDACRSRFFDENLEIVTPKVVQQLSEAELCNMIVDVDGVIAGDDPFTAKVIEIGRKGRLKVLAKWGIGIDGIDLNAAKKLGVFTSNTPNVFGDEVGDVALGYVILLARELHKMDSAVRKGHWLKIQGRTLRGKVAGIIGLGSIGQAIAKRLSAIGMELLGYDVREIPKEFCIGTKLRQVELDQLFQQSDCIVLACNLTQDNFHLLDEASFAKMKQGVWIVNVARGSLIKEQALIQALNDGTVEKVALDVFENEPLVSNNCLTQMSQVILGSHNSSNTKEAVLRVNQLAIDNLVRDLKRAEQGEKP